MGVIAIHFTCYFCPQYDLYAFFPTSFINFNISGICVASAESKQYHSIFACNFATYCLSLPDPTSRKAAGSLMFIWKLAFRFVGGSELFLLHSFGIAALIIWNSLTEPVPSPLTLHLPRIVSHVPKNPSLPAGLQPLITLRLRAYLTEPTYTGYFVCPLDICW